MLSVAYRSYIYSLHKVGVLLQRSPDYNLYQSFPASATAGANPLIGRAFHGGIFADGWRLMSWSKGLMNLGSTLYTWIYKANSVRWYSCLMLKGEPCNHPNERIEGVSTKSSIQQKQQYITNCNTWATATKSRHICK